MFITRLFISSLLTILLISCGGTTEYAEENSEGSLGEPLPDPEKEEWILGGKAFGIFHEVSDYSKWKSVFDQDEPKREQSGFQFLDILSSADNANSLAVFFMTPDHKVARDFISDDLKSRMEEAGVVSEPLFIMYDIVFLSTKDYNSIPYRVGASYKVKNFKSWLDKFTADREYREKAGLLDIGVAQSPESPRMVYIMMAVKNLEDGRIFIENERVSEKMSDYGVVGEATFNFWKRAEYAQD